MWVCCCVRHRVTDQQVTFRESVHLGTTTLSSREVESIISELKPDFPPDSYNLLSKCVARTCVSCLAIPVASRVRLCVAEC